MNIIGFYLELWEYIVYKKGVEFMILSIDLNPSLDRRYFIQNFEIGKSYTAYDTQYIPGGWGLDIAKIIKSFNEPIKVTGFLGGRNGKYVLEILNNMNINSEFVFIEEETRTNTKILTDYGIETEISERSPHLSNDEVVEFYELYRELIKETKIICASGKISRELPTDIYKDLILMAKEEDKTFLLDTSGEALRYGIHAAPFLIKPNRDELEEYMGFIMTNERDIIKSCTYIIENGVKMVVVSLGKAGAIVVYDGYSYKINVPSIKEVNSNGAGSAMMAGFAISMLRQYDFEYMLKIAAACGVASAMEMDTGVIDMGNMKSIASEIEIEKKLIF